MTVPASPVWGWEECFPWEVKVGDEVCFSRNVLIRDDIALTGALSLNWPDLGRPVMLMLYGRVVKAPKSGPKLSSEEASTNWYMSIDVWNLSFIYRQGANASFQFGEHGDEKVPGIDKEVIAIFTFEESETLTKVLTDLADV